MVLHTLRTALRSLRRHPATTTINAIGLALGVGAAGLILLFVRSELSVNDAIPESDRIYRVDSRSTVGEPGSPFLSPAPASRTMEAAYPAVDAHAWSYGIWLTVGAGGDFVRRDGWLVNPGFLDAVPLPLLYGERETALSEPRSVVLHETLARTLFGTADVVGRTVDVKTWQNGQQTHTVTGVWEALPRNSITQFRGSQYRMLLSGAGAADFTQEAAFENWDYDFLVQYIRVADDASVSALQQEIADFASSYVAGDRAETLAFSLNPLSSLYLTDQDGQGWARVYLAAGLAVLVLLIAGINVTNLSLVRALDQTREVGVRKTLGARRRHLAGRFLAESVLCGLLATLAGGMLMIGAFERFAELTGAAFVLEAPMDLTTVAGLAVIGVGMGVASGAYPSLVLSGAGPRAVLRDRGSLNGIVGSTGRLREGLIVGQFAVVVVLMVGVFIVDKQVGFATTQETPFPAERMVTIDSAPRDYSVEGYRRMQTARAEIEALPEVEAASVSWSVPSATLQPGQNRVALRRPSWSDDRSVSAASIARVDAHFADAYDLTVTDGRFFQTPISQDSSGVVLNETAVRALGLSTPAGTVLEMDGERRTVIGVVEDFNGQNVRYGASPLVLTPLQPGQWFRTVTATLAPGATNAVDRVRETWSDVLPTTPFVYAYLSDTFAQGYATEQQTKRLIGAGAALALGVALLGLVGITSFSVRRRRKEIGIRKALGASVSRIVALLTRSFAGLVGIAFLLGAPVAYVVARWWLSGFAKHIDLTPWPFLAVGASIVTVALLAVALPALRAARVDPATTLRDE